MIKVTLPAVRVALRSVVAEFGEDYVYPRQTDLPSHIDPQGDAGGDCFYVHDSDKGSVPGCLVARVLHDHFEWSVDDLKRIEGRSAREIPGLPADVGSYLWHAQSRQDTEYSWGFAAKEAERSLGG